MRLKRKQRHLPSGRRRLYDMILHNEEGASADDYVGEKCKQCVNVGISALIFPVHSL
jgi:hypothetical protein